MYLHSLQQNFKQSLICYLARQDGKDLQIVYQLASYGAQFEMRDAARSASFGVTDSLLSKVILLYGLDVSETQAPQHLLSALHLVQQEQYLCLPKLHYYRNSIQS